MTILFIFIDGVGLSNDDPTTNPFSIANLPNLHKLLDGRTLLQSSAPYHGKHATLLALDASLNVQGLPQSATGQAALLTGKNVPTLLGYHYGPKPNPDVATFLKNGNIFRTLVQQKRRVIFLNAYPPRYFESINSGRRLYSAIPLAVTSAGLALKTIDDLNNGGALSADFTATGWREHLGITDVPVLSAYQAGEQLAKLSLEYDFAFFEYWMSDYAGHRQDMDQAIQLLEQFDKVINGLIDHWQEETGLIIITSDHGNLEDLSTRRHTQNPVPAIIIGDQRQRELFSSNLHDLTGIAPAILRNLQIVPTL
jgi:hypothetical protein